MSLAKTKPAKKTTAKKGKPNTPLEQFHAYWQQIEKLKKRLARKDDDKAQLLARFEREIRPLEEAQCQATYRHVERLLTFFGRKSLTLWQRDILGDWIEQELQFLGSHPFRGDLDLTALYRQLQQSCVARASPEQINEQLGEVRELIRELLGEDDIDVSDDDLRACLDDPANLHALLDRLVAERDAAARDPEGHGDGGEEMDDEEDWFGDGWNAEEAGQGEKNDTGKWPEDEAEQARLETLLAKSTLKVLYRKLALVLHPDRVRDAEQQQERSALMVTLSQAWEHKDMFTLLTMAHEHLPAEEQFMSEQNLAAINPLLARKIRDMEMDLHRDQDNGLASLVYRKFKGRSKKATEREFAEHLDYLQRHIAQTETWLASTTSLKALKPYLEERWERQQWSSIVNFID